MTNSAGPKRTRSIRIGSIFIGGGNPVAVQSMTATATEDVDATVSQIRMLEDAGAAVVRIAVDRKSEADAIEEIRRQTRGNLCIDLQENYRLAEVVAPHVDKIRYNPGHLYHHEKARPVSEKVRFLVSVARDNDCAMRIGVNCGSVDPDKVGEFENDSIGAMVSSALQHADLVEACDFTRFCISLKDSDPAAVIEANRQLSDARPDIPLHLGVTEAGLPPDGVIKTRIAFEQLLAQGIGDTLRVSLTVPNSEKHQEITAGNQILEDVKNGRFRSVPTFLEGKLNIISCPSCSRVENDAFVKLAQDVKSMTDYARNHEITVAIMGCRVNGPGETDDADLGLWCAPNYVNFKRGPELIGAFPYEEILPRLKEELDRLIAARP